MDWSKAQQQNMSGGGNDWQKALGDMSLLALSNGADAQTMLGFALGKWLSGYLGRGQENADAKKINQANLPTTGDIIDGAKDAGLIGNKSGTQATAPKPELLLGTLPSLANIDKASIGGTNTPVEYDFMIKQTPFQTATTAKPLKLF